MAPRLPFSGFRSPKRRAYLLRPSTLYPDLLSYLLLTWVTCPHSVGKLRLQLPKPIARHAGVINATTFGNQCIQQTLGLPTLLPNMPPDIGAFVAPMATPPAVPQSEDCECPVEFAISYSSGTNAPMQVSTSTSSSQRGRGQERSFRSLL